ncbi:uncharacterized protein Dere_GG26136 [Drosophila erecta]|nr:uncharacterized protein Dere_GG26136 [Drosophila erecta]
MICRLPGRCFGQELELQFLGFRDSGIRGYNDDEKGQQERSTSLSGEQWRPAWSNMTLESRISSRWIRERPLVSGELVLSTWIWMRGVQRPEGGVAALPLFKCSPFYCQVRTGPG